MTEKDLVRLFKVGSEAMKRRYVTTIVVTTDYDPEQVSLGMIVEVNDSMTVTYTEEEGDDFDDEDPAEEYYGQ